MFAFPNWRCLTITALVVCFLIAHGLLHVAIFSPRTDPGAPFDPGHSWLLADTHVGAPAQRLTGTGLAIATAGLYIGAGLVVLVTGRWTPALVVGAAACGLALKLAWFNPWLLLGIALDVGVAYAAFAGIPSSLAG